MMQLYNVKQCSKKFLFRRLIPRSLYLGEHFTRGSTKEIELTIPAPLAGRKYLPSSDYPGFPKFLSGPRENCPLLVKAQNGRGTSLEDWAKKSREVIDEAYRQYDKDGTAVAILFRGLPVSNHKDFSVWANNLGYEPFSYDDGTEPRNVIEENVTDGSPEPKEFTVELHSELSYRIKRPDIMTMSSIKTAPWGGETALCDVRQMVAKLDPRFVEKCERKKIRYWHFLPGDVTESERQGPSSQCWQVKFMTEDRAKVETYLEENGYGYVWEEGSLLYWSIHSPFMSHPRSGERLWYSQAATMHYTAQKSSPSFEGVEVELPNRKYPYHTSYGDGEEIDQSLIDEHRRIAWESAVGFQWRDGDVLFIDQLIVQHSRLGFTGEREVAISLFTF